MKWAYILFMLVSMCFKFGEFSELQNITSPYPCTDLNHLFLAPGVLTAGGSNRACVSRFAPDGPARMELTLISGDEAEAMASRELPPGDGGCIDIAVPQKPNTKAKLVVSLWYPESKCSWQRELAVTISSGRVVVAHTERSRYRPGDTLRARVIVLKPDLTPAHGVRELAVTISSGRVVVAHTERSRYRPGDTLRARVIVLKPDLTPAHGVIDEVWLEGPAGAWEGTRAAQWFRVRTRMGIAQLQHELVGAPTGRWTLRVKLADGAQGAAVFWVGNYELPPFQLSVRHAPRVLRTSERLVWTVCVRYPWTEAVEGMLVIRIRGAGGTVVAQEASSSSIKTVVRIKAPRACHRHAAAARRVGLNGTNPPDVVVADFSFQVSVPISEWILFVKSSIKTVVRIKAPRACHRHAAARRVGLNGTNPPDVVVADFSFQEDGTRIWQNTTVVSEVVDSPISLQFLTKHRPVISPGLPYKLKVKATRWDDKPAANERIKVCRVPGFLADYKPSALNDSCHEALTDDKGVAKVMFTANEDGGSYYNFQASLHNDSSVSTSLYVATRRDDVTAALGPLRPEAGSGRTFVPLYINLRNVSKPLTVHFVVITRGGTIYRWGATTQCPQTSSSDYIPTTSRNAQCYNANPDFTVTNSQTNSARILSNDTIFDGNDPDTLLDRHMLRVMLPIKVTHQMCPDSHLIAYFYFNGELVSASKQFEMDECFSNKVEATWLSRQVAPGGTASLRITTPGPALCALTVVDSAAKWNQPAPTVRELVMTGLRRLMDSHRNLTEYEAAGSCFLTTDLQQFPSSSIELTATWLAVAGVRVAGGGNRAGIACLAPPSPMFEDSTVPRSDFSEAWLWRLVGVGGNGSAVASAKAPDSISRFEASAVCLARTGIAISQPAVLQVFREFFIHADCPRRLKRGDATIVRYRLFNYLYEPLSVQIQILTDARLEGPTEHVEWACVPARASVARRAEIRARLTGNARLSVRAKAVRDRSCANGTAASSQASDEVIINITVDPEGVPVQEHKSILLCGKGSIESSQSEVSWTWPPIQPVPGTESLTVWAIGDVTGPLLADADSLVTLPRGCGEQNMARLATNLLALSQLDPAGAPAATAKLHVARGFTRQLQYAHAHGGFSAFGPADETPSTWLTAFALRYLRRAHQILTPGLPVPPAIERAERWLLDQQMENGCFRNEGQVFHKELRGGLNEEGEIASVALTAYVIASLVESTAPLPARVLRNTLSCLRALPPMKARTPTRVYAHALLGYTFMRLRSYEDELRKARTPTRVYAHALLGYTFMRLRSYEDELRKSNEASLVWDSKEAVGAGLKEEEELGELMELLKIARRNGDYVWWETSSLSTSIEATGYALLALSYCPSSLRATSCAVDARAATRWLSSHRSFAGGFLSTQDTLVALEALTAWSSVQPPPAANLTVRVRSGDAKPTLLHPGGKVPDMVKMTACGQLDVAVEALQPLALANLTVRVASDAKPTLQTGGKVPDMVKMTASGQLDVAVEGTGCALIQATRSHHSAGSDRDLDKRLSVQASVSTDGSFDCDASGNNCFCAAVVEACVVWAGAFPAMALLELALPAGFGADAPRLYAQRTRDHALLRRIELAPNGGRATLYLGTRDGTSPARGGHACFNVHAVGPRARTRPAHVRVIDYYAPTANDTQMYTIPEDCPARITHESPEYHSSDNLFTKAKSLNHSGELVITHEFSFEDIPEGIPLEDPIYDTLNRDEIAYLTKFNEVTPRKNTEYDENSINNIPEDIFTTEMNSKTNEQINNEQTEKLKITFSDAAEEPTHDSTRKGKSYSQANFRNTENSNYFARNSNQAYSPSLANFDDDQEKFDDPEVAYKDYSDTVTRTFTLNYNNYYDNYIKKHNITPEPRIASTRDIQYNDSNANWLIKEKEDLSNSNTTVTKAMSEALTELSSPKYEENVSPNLAPTIQEHKTSTPIEELTNPNAETPKEASLGEVMNPNLASFHIIDSEKDLEVPTGIEGPVPAVVLPPQNFVAVPPPPGFQPQFVIGGYPRGLPSPSAYYLPPFRSDATYIRYPYYYGRNSPPAG